MQTLLHRVLCRTTTKLAQLVVRRVYRFKNWKMPVTIYSFHLMLQSSSVRISVSLDSHLSTDLLQWFHYTPDTKHMYRARCI